MIKADVMEGYDCRTSGVSFFGHCESPMRSVEQVFIVILTGVEQSAGQDWAGGDSCQVWTGTAGIVGAHRKMKAGCYL